MTQIQMRRIGQVLLASFMLMALVVEPAFAAKSKAKWKGARTAGYGLEQVSLPEDKFGFMPAGQLEKELGEARYEVLQLQAPESALEERSAQFAVPMAMTAAVSTTTPEVARLARALKDNPDLIYQYVKDIVEYEHVWGSVREPDVTILDGKGNAFDQSRLMVELLKAAGYDARFVYGTIRISAQDAQNWYGIEPDVRNASSLFYVAGYPRPSYSYNATDYTLYELVLHHVWVRVNIDGTDYVFDPSLKSHKITAPTIDLATAMGYDRTAFIASTLGGASYGTDSVSGVDRTAVRNGMDQYASNLVSYIRTNKPGATLDDLIGGKKMRHANIGQRLTTLSYQESEVEEWTSIQYQANVRVQHLGIDHTFTSDAIYGKRLTITYDGQNRAVLTLDGAAVATGNVGTPGTSYDITLSVDFPYDIGPDRLERNASKTFHIAAGGTYCIANHWGGVGAGLVEHHRKRLQEARDAGVAEGTEEVLGGALNLMSLQYMAQKNLGNLIEGRLTKRLPIRHFHMGVVAQTDYTYIDLPLGFMGVARLSQNVSATFPMSLSTGARMGALESGLVEQTQGIEGISTPKLFDLAADAGNTFYQATSANFASIKPLLSNYSAGEEALINSYLQQGRTCVLPSDGNLGVGSWSGIGFVAYLQSSPDSGACGQIIGGGLKGGYSSTYNSMDYFRSALSMSRDYRVTSSLGGDPIDMATGAYLYENSDLAIGSDEAPVGLGLKRKYHSDANIKDKGLGNGWSFNYDIKVSESSDGLQGLGSTFSPIDAASALAAIWIGSDLVNDQVSFDRIVVGQIIADWFAEELTDNVVTVERPGELRQFTKLADGTYNPPLGIVDKLEKETDGTYLFTSKDMSTLDFNADGRIETWADPNGNTVSFSYTDGKLQTVQNAFSRTLTFTWSGDQLSQVSDGTGRQVSYAYDTAGNLVSYTDAGGNATVYEYNADNRMTKVFYATAPTVAYVDNTYDDHGDVISQLNVKGAQYRYYYAGYRTEQVDPLGYSTIWFFDENDHQLAEINAVGARENRSYDGKGRLTSIVHPQGDSEVYEYDLNSNVNKVTKTPRTGFTSANIVEEYVYHQNFNKVTWHKDALGREINKLYDASGNLLRVELPAVGGVISTIEYTYNTKGQQLTETAADGMVTTHIYDAVTGNKLSTSVDSANLGLATGYGYDNVGNVVTETDPSGNATTRVFDAMRRMTQSTAPAPLNYVTKYTYDAEGHVTKVERQTDDPANPWQTETTTYTPSGQKLTVTDAEGKVTTYDYDQLDREWKVTDAEARVTEIQYDSAGRKWKIINPAGDADRTMTYTPNGKLYRLTDAKGNITTYYYDGHDRLLHTQYPDGRVETLSYDAVGNLLVENTRGNLEIKYTYDELNRKLSKEIPGWGTHAYTYDAAGRVLTATGGGGTTTYVYDTAGRLSTVTYPVLNKTVTYTYDANGNKTKVSYPGNVFWVDYEYDALNRVTRLTDSSGVVQAQYAYDSLSRRTAASLGNGATESYSYSADNDKTQIAYQWSGANATLDYTYDDTGLRVGLDVSDNRFAPNFPADGTTTYVSNNFNQYTSVNGTALTYNYSGTAHGYGNNRYHHDAANRILQVEQTTPAQNWKYYYDGFDRRVFKMLGSTWTMYIYDGDNVIAEYNNQGQLVRRYVQGINVDDPVSMDSGYGRFYYHRDSLGSVVALSANNGTLYEVYKYTPFGAPDHNSPVGNPYYFASRRYDTETGVYYSRARYLDTYLRRFLQPDPKKYEDGMNMYSYVRNNPVMYTDPYGLDTWGIDLAITGNFMGLGGTIGVTFAIDDSWNIAGVLHYGGGGAVSPPYSWGGGAAIQGQYTTANTVYDLRGGSVSLGGAVPLVHGVGISSEAIFASNYRGVNAGLSFGGYSMTGLVETSHVFGRK